MTTKSLAIILAGVIKDAIKKEAEANSIDPKGWEAGYQTGRVQAYDTALTYVNEIEEK